MGIKKRAPRRRATIFNARKRHFMHLALRSFPFLLVTPLFFCSHFHLFIPSPVLVSRCVIRDPNREVLRAPLPQQAYPTIVQERASLG